MAKATHKALKTIMPKKRSIRFAPDPNTLAQVNFGSSEKKSETVLGLVLNESKTGFAALFNTSVKIKENMNCNCRVGQLPDTKAQVRWFTILEKDIVKVGFEYSR